MSPGANPCCKSWSRVAAEEVLQRVADPVRARADAEQDEAEDEDDSEQNVDHLRVVAQTREEELVLPGGCALRALRIGLGALLPRRRCGSSGHQPP